MANVSTVTGSFTFQEDFYKEHKTVIDSYFDQAVLQAYYGIEVDGHEENMFDFTGSGRWSMQNTLPWALEPVDSYDLSTQVTNLFKKWFVALQETGATVEFDYIDYEPGSELYVHEIVTIAPKQGNFEELSKLEGMFQIVNVHSTDLGYSEGALIRDDYEEGYLLTLEEDKAMVASKLADWFSRWGADYQGYTTTRFVDEVLDYLKADDGFDGGVESWHFDDDNQIQDLIDVAVQA